MKKSKFVKEEHKQADMKLKEIGNEYLTTAKKMKVKITELKNKNDKEDEETIKT